MLTLKDIKKDYKMADLTVEALKGVSLSFRKNEFVSILGPSGCGKTTMLNIIGGLDHYTSGDLVIDSISTKNYNDRDWDTYRNHRVGFIFQSYNLIPHQTVLENVELALNISGIDKKERTKRAKEALIKVGLDGQFKKKPNQLSGGQCQRVAIARALVNDPEILLADEPTGALDTETSKQIMDLIKEIANDCLVIMVTHNPELAEQYSTRIIKLLDGEVISDTNPYDGKMENTKRKEKPTKKSKLKFWSAFRLSSKNLISKLKRTLMVCFAGSIGIIGVASVLAVSTGVHSYINKMQNDMLSGNPIEISEESYDLSSIMDMSSNAMLTEAVKASIEDGKVNVDMLIDFLIKRSDDLKSLKVSNDITKEYVSYVLNMPENYVHEISLNYGLDLTNNIYTNFSFNSQENNNMSLSCAMQMYMSMLAKTEQKDIGDYLSMLGESFVQAPKSEEFILSQYDIVSNKETSKIATKSDEVMIVLNKNAELTDILLAQLGYYTQDEFFNLIYKSTEDSKYNENLYKDKFTYDELLNKTFTYYPNNVVFNKTDISSPLAKVNPFTYNPYVNSNWIGGKELKITAILMPKEDLSYGALTSGFYYTEALTDEILLDSIASEIVQYLIANNMQSFNSTQYNGMNTGIIYNYSFEYLGETFANQTGFVGSTDQMSALIGSMTGQNIPVYYTLSLRDVGGITLPNNIEVYPVDFEIKDEVTQYLDNWNNADIITIDGVDLTKDVRSEIKYSDNLAIVISLISSMIDIVTTALVAFTALSLVVSTVMVAIITYVSVIERVKEIGVIRSLGGRKKDVSRLFNAETFIIGGVSGLIGVGVTYLLSAILNLLVGGLIGTNIAVLTIPTALIMISISIGLTLISGLVPARLAAKKDPVVALRTE